MIRVIIDFVVYLSSPLNNLDTLASVAPMSFARSFCLCTRALLRR
nr:MAG TPA: hypothetical protein [Caudoviricetes sp.]